MNTSSLTGLVSIFLLASLSCSSCSKYLDTSPTTDVDKGVVLKDAESMELALDGIYATMYNRIDFVTANAHQCFGNMAVTLTAELMGDDMVHTAQGAGWFWKDYNYEMRRRYTSKIWRSYFTWSYFYEIINNANYILAALPSASGDKKELQDIEAQARSIRAFSYFMLAQNFQQTLVGHENLPGVPIYTSPTTDVTKGNGRGKLSTVYKLIDDDLEKSLALFQASGLARKHISHLDYCSTLLLKARVSLVENKWKAASDAADLVISKSTARLLTRSEATVKKGTFNDADPKQWTTGTTPFNKISCPSILWGAEQLSEQSNVYASFYSHMDACTDCYYAAESPKCISNWLYAQIKDTDIRKGWWNGNIGRPKSSWNYGANIDYNQYKFQWLDQKAHTGDYIFMRLEEAYLIKSEALCRQKDYPGARAALKELLSRRDTASLAYLDVLNGDTQSFGTVGTVTTLLDEILVQRRIELWGEIGRIYDILRLGKGWTRYWNVGGEESNHTNYLTKYAEYLQFPADFRECIMMIPQCEIDNNPNINPEDQNPYVEE